MYYGRQVTTETAENLEGIFIDSDTFFHFVLDINGNYFLMLSTQDEIDILETEYAYLLEIPLTEYIPPIQPEPPI